MIILFKNMSKVLIDLSVIKNRKLFEKQLYKTTGFSETNRSLGIDSRAMIFIPDQQILAVAGLQEQNDKPQQLTLYKIEATVDKTTKSGRFLEQIKESKIGGQLGGKKRNSAIYTYSKTSLMDNMLKKKEVEAELNKKQNKSNQSSNVVKNSSTQMSGIILETDEDSKSKIR